MNLKNTRTAKLAAGVVGISMAISAFVPSLASADTASDLQAQINSLLATISSLQSQLAATTGGSSVSTGYTFNTNLTVGSKGTDVMNLQKVLNMSADTKVASSGAGSPGMETSTFGPATKAAVIKFQTKYGISPAAGYVGAITRAKLNSMGGAVSTTPTTPGTTLPTGGALSVSAGSQPANSLAPLGAARIPFTTVVLTAGSADVTVNSITVQRTGLAQDASLSGVVLLKSDGTQIGIAKTLNSNHQAMVGEPFVVKAGTSMTVTVAGNRPSSDSSAYAGQVVSLDVVAVNTSASVSGSMPITGAMHTINSSLTLGTASLAVSSFDPGSAQTKEIGTTGYKFAGVRVTAGSAEQVRLWSVRFNQSGSASSNDLANVKVYVDGTAYDTTVSTDGKYYTASFSGGLLIDKGLSKDVYIQGDIVGAGASGRTVKFDVYKNTDIYVSGVTYGYGITPTASNTGAASDSTSEFTTGTPFFDGSKVTVSGGSATSIQRATSVAAQSIALNVPNQILGGFSTDIKGEAMSVQSMVFNFNYSAGVSASSYLLTSVSLVDSNGAVVAGPVDATNVGGTAQKVTFTDSVTLPVGQRTYRLQGKLPSGIPNNTTITASTTPSSDWSNITGQTTGNTISLSGNGVFSMNTMTVRAAALAITVATTPSAQSIVAGGQGVTFANYQLDASLSGEDVRFSSIPLKITFSGAANNVTSCQLFDGSTALNTGSNVVNPASSVTTGSDVTFTLDQSLVVPKGTVKTLALKCNVASGATGSMSWGIQASPSITVTGVTSSNDVTETVSASVGQTMTFGSASLAVTTDSNSPSYTTVTAGSTGVVVGAFKFTASNEDINLKRVALKLTNTASSSSSDLIKVSLYDGATKVGDATFTGNGTYATSTFETPVSISKNTPKVLTLKADLAAIGTNLDGREGALIAVDINGNDSTGTQGNGASSGAVVNASGSTSVAGVRMFKAIPVFSYSNTSGVAQSGNNDLLVLNVTANGTGDVQLNKLTFAVATTTANLTNPTFSGPNGSVGSVTLTSTTLTVTFDSASNVADRTVSVGSTKTYTLRGDIALTGNTNTTGSVGVSLKADTAYPSLSTLMTPVAGLSSSNIIWSPNSTTSPSSTSADDWTNGYGLGGCFATSGLGQNCFSRVLSK